MLRKLIVAGGFLLLLVICMAIFAWDAYPTLNAESISMIENTEEHAARGFGQESARVDSQITFAIPKGKSDAVYAYLKENYVAKEGILHEQFPDINLHGQTMSDTSIFTDVYYDTPSLVLYKNRNSTRHRKRVNTTNPDDRKNGRELVQVKITPPGDFELRTEVKYDVTDDPNDDNHPLIRLIDPSQQEDFKQLYRNVGINPYDLRHIFTIKQTRRRGYINWDDTNIFSFSVDDGSASMLGAKGTFSSVDMGLVEAEYTEADEQKRQLMWDIRTAIIDDLQKQFPNLEQTTNSKYGITLEQIIKKNPLIPALIRAKLLN